MNGISESEWKKLRKLQPIALNRLCQGILDDVATFASKTEGDSHQRFLEMYKFVHQQNENVSLAFDDLRRSNALEKLAWMVSLELVSDEEFALFSEESRKTVQFFLDLRNDS